MFRVPRPVAPGFRPSEFGILSDLGFQLSVFRWFQVSGISAFNFLLSAFPQALNHQPSTINHPPNCTILHQFAPFPG
jgi:hypothetical protein